MTMMDKVNAGANSIAHALFDKEALSYPEATAAYAMIAQGRMNNAVLSVMYNHARDPEVKELVLQALKDHNQAAVNLAEKLLQESGGELPHFYFQERKLHDEPVEIPPDARLTDEEIVLGVATMGKAAQMMLLSTIHQSYQPDVAIAYRKRLDEGMDFNYRILQLALKHGWLPRLDKIH
ncbi:MAG: DUF3231 family protein [Sporomusaceae bacterium]|nr:DUF3231 family protein [Sporomusaceae bacterium]